MVLVATGSEVHVALEAQARLAEEGLSARVVSMPSWELFAEQEATYREGVLPRGLPKVVVEAAVSFGWERWVGADAAFVTLERFGASAPGPVLYEKFGITPERVVEAARTAAVQ